MRVASILGSIALAGIVNCAVNIAPSSADMKFRPCVGEYDDKCPVAHDAWFGCGTTPDQMGQTLCTVHYPDGKTKTSPYRYVHQGSHEGNRCGYEWYSLTCLDEK